MAASYLSDLVETAARIGQLDELERELTDKREWQGGKEEWEAQQEHFKKLRAEYVDQLLNEEGARETVVADVQGQLDALREEADPSWYPALDYTRDNLMPYLEKEAGRTPQMRKVRKAAPWAAGALAVLIYFAIRLFSGTPVTEDIQTREGIQQRAAAVEKVIRYDDWMGTRVRRGGWVKGILFWPIKPTEPEIDGAADFVGLVLEGQQYARGCGSVTGPENRLTDQQIKLVDEVADYVQSSDVRWEDPPVATVITGLERATNC